MPCDNAGVPHFLVRGAIKPSDDPRFTNECLSIGCQIGVTHVDLLFFRQGFRRISATPRYCPTRLGFSVPTKSAGLSSMAVFDCVLKIETIRFGFSEMAVRKFRVVCSTCDSENVCDIEIRV